MPPQVLAQRVRADAALADVGTPRIDRAATERWMRILFEESMVRAIPGFDDVVDTTIVDAVESASVSV